MVRARSAVVASLLAAGVVLAGCGGPQEPKPLEGQQNAQDNAPDDAGGDQGDDSGDEGPSNGDDSTPSDEGGDDGGRVEQRVEPGEDNKAGGEDAKLAESIVRSYIKAVNKATATGDLSGVNKLGGPDCQICNTSRKNITTGYADGGRIEGGGYSDPQIDVGAMSGRVVKVSVMSWFTAYKMFDSAGEITASGPKEFATFLYEVDLDAGKIIKGEQR